MKDTCQYDKNADGTMTCSQCGHVRKYVEKYFRDCPAFKSPDLFKSRGLGDTIAKITHATGIAQVVEAVSQIAGVPCGCAERQQWLNKVVPYRQE
jgi:hypothetical protein